MVQAAGDLPIARNERRDPTWIPVNHDDIAAMAHGVERFSSRDTAARRR